MPWHTGDKCLEMVNLYIAVDPWHGTRLRHQSANVYSTTGINIQT